MYNKVKANVGLNYHSCAVNNFDTHLAIKHASYLEYCYVDFAA